MAEEEPREVIEDPDETEEERHDPEVAARRAAAMAFIRRYGDPVLKSRASEVVDFGDALHGDVERMLHVMHDGMGVGLAATQLGMLRRLLVFLAGSEAQPSALVNPAVVWLSDELAVAEEGCLSFPRISVDVERPLHARVNGVDLEGDPVVLEASGLEARVLQHEIDHLDGVLILDHAPRDQRKEAMRAMRAALEEREG